MPSNLNMSAADWRGNIAALYSGGQQSLIQFCREHNHAEYQTPTARMYGCVFLARHEPFKKNKIKYLWEVVLNNDAKTRLAGYANAYQTAHRVLAFRHLTDLGKLVKSGVLVFNALVPEDEVLTIYGASKMHGYQVGKSDTQFWFTSDPLAVPIYQKVASLVLAYANPCVGKPLPDPFPITIRHGMDIHTRKMSRMFTAYKSGRVIYHGSKFGRMLESCELFRAGMKG